MKHLQGVSKAALFVACCGLEEVTHIADIRCKDIYAIAHARVQACSHKVTSSTHTASSQPYFTTHNAITPSTHIQNDYLPEQVQQDPCCSGVAAEKPHSISFRMTHTQSGVKGSMKLGTKGVLSWITLLCEILPRSFRMEIVCKSKGRGHLAARAACSPPKKRIFARLRSPSVSLDPWHAHLKLRHIQGMAVKKSILPWAALFHIESGNPYQHLRLFFCVGLSHDSGVSEFH